MLEIKELFFSSKQGLDCMRIPIDEKTRKFGVDDSDLLKDRC
jgi:hypothetical protein